MGYAIPSEVMEPPCPRACAFYQDALRALAAARVPFMLGGAYALARYTGVVRHTKDLDFFVGQDGVAAARAALEQAGYRTELTYPHWLAKAFSDGHFVDLIFNLGNGTMPVDAAWLERSREGEVFGHKVRLLSPEDMVWSKVFVMDRGRFDGADIAHVIRACGREMDWRQMLDRAGRHWRVLLSHLTMFGYVYPSERGAIPDWVLRELAGRLQAEARADGAAEPVCQGTLLSPTQYRIDVEQWGYRDARLPPHGAMTPEQIDTWTEGVIAGK